MGEGPGIVVTGASGRMGQMLVRLIAASDRARLVACVERPGHPWIGRDIGAAMGGADLGVTVTDDALEAFARAQAVVDFTSPEASLGFAALAAQARAVHVIGTTGFTPEQIARLEPAARHAVIVRAGNMSLGVNLLVQLTRKVAEALDGRLHGRGGSGGAGRDACGCVGPRPRRHDRGANAGRHRVFISARWRHRGRA